MQKLLVMTAAIAGGTHAQLTAGFSNVETPFCSAEDPCAAKVVISRPPPPPCYTCPDPITVTSSESLSCARLNFTWDYPDTCRKIGQYQIRVRDFQGKYQDVPVSIGPGIKRGVSAWSLRAAPFGLKDGDKVMHQIRSWSGNGWSQWSAEQTDEATMAVLVACPPKTPPAKKGCCDPCDADTTEPKPAVVLGTPLVAPSVLQLDTSVETKYPSFFEGPAEIFTAEDCCKMPVELQPHCGGCKPKCKDCRVVDETPEPEFAPPPQKCTETSSSGCFTALISCCQQPADQQVWCGGCNANAASPADTTEGGN